MRLSESKKEKQKTKILFKTTDNKKQRGILGRQVAHDSDVKRGRTRDAPSGQRRASHR